jgi:hypothetical protein
VPNYSRGNPGGRSGAMTAASPSRGRVGTVLQKTGTIVGSPPKSVKPPLPPRRLGAFKGVGHTTLRPGKTQGSNPTAPLSRGHG